MVNGVFSIPLDASDSAQKPPAAKALAARLPLAEFIGGEENALARVAAQSILNSPDLFNPLVFVGPTGVGKSHLARGLVAKWRQQERGRRALITTGADFAREFASAVDTDSLPDLRERFFTADLLLVDNLHELAGKRAAQQELARVLDLLLDERRPVIGTAPQLPATLAGLTESLASRLSGGLTVPLSAPGVLARRSILGKLATYYGVPLSRSAVHLLAERFPGTVPNLNHIVVELEQEGRGGKRPRYEEAVADLIAFHAPDSKPSVRSISATTAKHFHLKPALLKGQSRRAAVAHARSVAMYLVRQLTELTLDEIGEQFGGRDHTTVLHACRKIESLHEEDDETKHVIDELTHEIKASCSVWPSEYRNS